MSYSAPVAAGDGTERRNRERIRVGPIQIGEYRHITRLASIDQAISRNQLELFRANTLSAIPNPTYLRKGARCFPWQSEVKPPLTVVLTCLKNDEL